MLGLAALSWLGAVLFVQTVLETPPLAEVFLSTGRWIQLARDLGGTIGTQDGSPIATVPFAAIAWRLSLAGVLFLAVSAFVHRRSPSAMWDAPRRLTVAWSPAGLWWLAWMMSLLTDWPVLAATLQQSVDLVAAACVALSLLAVLPTENAASPNDSSSGNPGHSRAARLTLAAGIVTYIVVFTAMNWGLWFNLRLPHGDSAMYEEHLWNLTHGKGFRSYLDQGLFLGEHLQVVHVLLLPLHVLFPSHLTLELAQSVILALGAWPLFNIARRHSGSEWAAALLGLAYLAYFPLQYLDISIDLKTFRPNSFGIPTLLAALDLLERRRWGWATFWLVITLSAQEDWAIPLALVGLWLVLHGPLREVDADRRREIVYGASLFVFGVVYLWFALNVAIPWFRGGATVHTASYFSKFGNSPTEIIFNMLTRPSLLWSVVVTSAAAVYALRLLLPIGFLPLRSPSRLAVAAPLFLLLLMNDLAMQVPAPVHHFHAPLIPILFWAAAAGLDPTAKWFRVRVGSR
jgi:uncharacterized membrane protein